jgi:hypothetical protein
MELSGQPDALAAWAPGKNTTVLWIRGWVNPRVVPEVLQKRKISLSYRHSKSTLSTMYPSHHIAYATPAPLHVSHFGVITISWKYLPLVSYWDVRTHYNIMISKKVLWRQNERFEVVTSIDIKTLVLWKVTLCCLFMFFFLLRLSSSAVLPPPKRGELTGDWRRWRNEELHVL